MSADAPASRTRRLALVAAMCLVLGALGGLAAASLTSEGEARPVRFHPPREPAFEFRLHDQAGRSVSLASARGKVIVLTFLYSSCRDLCPAQAGEIVKAVGSVGAGVVVYGVSVDPAGDTREHVSEWISKYGLEGAPVHFLIGTRRELEPVWRAYGITPIATTEAHEDYERYQAQGGAEGPYEPPRRPPSPAAREPYPDARDLRFRGRPRHEAGEAFEHSAYVLLIDKNGEQRVGFPFEQLDPELLAEDIRLLRDER